MRALTKTQQDELLRRSVSWPHDRHEHERMGACWWCEVQALVLAKLGRGTSVRLRSLAVHAQRSYREVTRLRKVLDASKGEV